MIDIKQIDYSFAKVSGDKEELLKIFNYFSYLVDGYQFQPLYKQGRWDGKVKMYDFVNKTMPLGLIPQLIEFLQKNGIQYSIINFDDNEFRIDYEYLEHCIKVYKIPMEVRDYQKKIVIECINQRRLLAISSTSSGKSLALYLIVRIMLENTKRCFIIVPNISLVTQLYKDFISYGWDEILVQESVHCIFGGQEKLFIKPVIISTWQSIFKPEVLSKFTSAINDTDKLYDCVIIDEAHKVKTSEGQKIGNILEKFTYSPWKLGVTGSLPKQELLKQQIIACLGNPLQIISASELVERGMATDLNISLIYLDYNTDERKYVKKLVKSKTWNEEMDFINTHPQKLGFILKLGLSKLNKNENSIIFFKRIAFGQALFNMFKEAGVPLDKLKYVDGSVKGDVREDIRTDMEEMSGVILIASYNTFSTGINIKQLNNGIFGENPGKSDVTLIQSLGRFLRQHSSKTQANIYDLVDDLRVKTYDNYAWRHFKERLDTYRNEGWFLNEKTFIFK